MFSSVWITLDLEGVVLVLVGAAAASAAEEEDDVDVDDDSGAGVEEEPFSLAAGADSLPLLPFVFSGSVAASELLGEASCEEGVEDAAEEVAAASSLPLEAAAAFDESSSSPVEGADMLESSAVPGADRLESSLAAAPLAAGTAVSSSSFFSSAPFPLSALSFESAEVALAEGIPSRISGFKSLAM